MNTKAVAYGSNTNGKYYVQTCCGAEHLGQKCNCKSLGEDFTESEAKKLAEQKAKELNVPVYKW